MARPHADRQRPQDRRLRWQRRRRSLHWCVKVDIVSTVYANGPFPDASVDVNSKRIAKVRVRCGDIIDSIQLEFSDGTTTDRHGGGGTKEGGLVPAMYEYLER